jgi:hypothetical protein
MKASEVVAAICHYLPCVAHPYEVLLMRADFAVWLLGSYASLIAKQRPSQGQGDPPGGWQRMADGREVMRITGGMEQLAAVLKGS